MVADGMECGAGRGKPLRPLPRIHAHGDWRYLNDPSIIMSALTRQGKRVPLKVLCVTKTLINQQVSKIKSD
jgi:hypothetical protein